jgi:hypothetical protein
VLASSGCSRNQPSDFSDVGISTNFKFFYLRNCRVEHAPINRNRNPNYFQILCEGVLLFQIDTSEAFQIERIIIGK